MTLEEHKAALEGERDQLEQEAKTRNEQIQRVMQAHNVRAAQINERLLQIQGALALCNALGSAAKE